ncbi:MAG: GTPase Era [Candidatus Bipolaricaulota bacterium]|nr:GTPase Era [Candidatus Bipolaricaulota bacterium]
MGNEGTGFRCGFVGVLGHTNVGKSTFLNAVMGERLLIMSAKPQSTRNSIRCIRTTETSQIVFVDTPGLHQPRNRLGRHLMREASRSLRDLDVIVYMVEPWRVVRDDDRAALERLARTGRPILVLVNKTDRARGGDLEETLLAYAALDIVTEIVPVSGTTGQGLDEAVATIVSHLPESPPLYPAETRCDRSEEFLIEEIIRENVMEVTHKEIPYSLAVRVKWLREREDGLVEIQAEIIVDRDSQKGILIGRGASRVRLIGRKARADIERFLGRHIYLEILVAVRAGWTRSDAQIRELTGAA